MYDLSVVIPAIRSHLWDNLYQSLCASIQQHSFQLILVGPFEPSHDLLSKNNVVFQKSYASPSVCAQIGVTFAESNLFYLNVDDNTYEPNVLDDVIDTAQKVLTEKDFLVCPYTEGGHENPLNPEYWRFWYHEGNRLNGIGPEWKLGPQAIYLVKTFKDMGGFQCFFDDGKEWEYIDAPQKDYCCRLQQNGGLAFVYHKKVAACTWTPDHQETHKPVHDALVENDEKIFRELWSNSNNRFKIDFNNYLKSPQTWKRRFTKSEYKTFEEMCKEEGYNI